MGGNVAENLSNQSVPEAAARVAAVVNRLVNRIGSNAESRERLAEIEIPEELRDNLALFLRLERRVLSEYDPEIADLFDKILTAEIVANAGNPGSRAADESVDEQGVPTADEPTAVAFREVVDLIDSLPLDKQQVIVRAFTSFFHLANLSEENYRVAQLREREAGASTDTEVDPANELDLAAARVQAGLAAGESIERIMDGMTTMLQHPLALGFDRTSLLCGLGGACAVGLFHLYRWSMKRNWRDGEEYGSARWSTSREMAPYTDNDTRQNLQMTATEGLSLDAPATRRNLNTAVIGGSGSGKTATHVIPNILKGSMNYACTDPKGELYAKTGGDLEKMGYTVKQLDLVDLTSETKFNPMRYIDPTKPDVAIMRLVTNIMDNTNGSTPKEHQTDDFWTKSERSLLTALTAFVYYLPDDILKDCLHIDAGQTLNAVADMRDLLEASEQDETKESQVDAVARTATEIYEETRAEWEREDADHDDPDLREAWRLAQGLKFAARQYRPFTQGAGETKKGIIISLGVRLAPLTVGPVREILSDDNLGIDRDRKSVV